MLLSYFRTGVVQQCGCEMRLMKSFFNWAIGRAVLEQSPAAGIPLPGNVSSRDRVLTDEELAEVILAARIPLPSDATTRCGVAGQLKRSLANDSELGSLPASRIQLGEG